jgi:single-strand DNA-binding protein
MNCVVVSGRLSSEPTVRELQSGSVLMTLELTTRVDDTNVSVPLVWFDPPSKVAVTVGDQVAAVGTVRRRFYRAGGITQSRTEVVVAQLAHATDKRGVGALQKWLVGVLGSDTGERLRSS